MGYQWRGSSLAKYTCQYHISYFIICFECIKLQQCAQLTWRWFPQNLHFERFLGNAAVNEQCVGRLMTCPPWRVLIEFSRKIVRISHINTFGLKFYWKKTEIILSMQIMNALENRDASSNFIRRFDWSTLLSMTIFYLSFKKIFVKFFFSLFFPFFLYPLKELLLFETCVLSLVNSFPSVWCSKSIDLISCLIKWW